MPRLACQAVPCQPGEPHGLMSSPWHPGRGPGCVPDQFRPPVSRQHRRSGRAKTLCERPARGSFVQPLKHGTFSWAYDGGDANVT